MNDPNAYFTDGENRKRREMQKRNEERLLLSLAETMKRSEGRDVLVLIIAQSRALAQNNLGDYAECAVANFGKAIVKKMGQADEEEAIKIVRPLLWK